MIDVGKVLRILERTSSTYDAEALTAIRKANEFLEATNMRWEQFFDELRAMGPSGIAPIRSSRPRKGKMAESQIGEVFDEIDDYSHLLSQNQAEWVERMRTAWEASDSLSNRQEEIITNILDELRDKSDRRRGS